MRPSLLALPLLLAGCTVGPDYQPPTVPAVVAFQNLPEGWTTGNPDAASRLPQAWWTVFHDAELNRLEEALNANNPQLEAAAARIEQARARLAGVRGALFPDVDLIPAASRSRRSSNDSNGGNFAMGATESYQLPLDASWEVDLWGRVRRGVGAFTADRQSLEAAEAASRLSLQAELAQAWFSLRAVEAEKTVLEESLKLQDENLELFNNRLAAGAATQLDVARVQSERATAAADLAGLDASRTELLAAIATLTGQPASRFSSTAPDLAGAPPRVPTGVPSTMLERRPDVAQAERQLAAANERIGLAHAALFPKLTLTGGLGLGSGDLGTLLEPDSRFWDFGANVFFPLLKRGPLHAAEDEAKAVFDEQFAVFRGQVLVAFQEVETALGALDALQRQEALLNQAVSAAQQGASLSNSRYREGLSSYLEVIDAQRTQLLLERQQVQVRGRRYQATVQLIRALGGGWE